MGEGNLPNTFTLPTYQPDRLIHILVGDYAAVIESINREVLRYCTKVAWIEPVPTGRSGDYQRHNPPPHPFGKLIVRSY